MVTVAKGGESGASECDMYTHNVPITLKYCISGRNAVHEKKIVTTSVHFQKKTIIQRFSK